MANESFPVYIESKRVGKHRGGNRVFLGRYSTSRTMGKRIIKILCQYELGVGLDLLGPVDSGCFLICVKSTGEVLQKWSSFAGRIAQLELNKHSR